MEATVWKVFKEITLAAEDLLPDTDPESSQTQHNIFEGSISVEAVYVSAFVWQRRFNNIM